MNDDSHGAVRTFTPYFVYQDAEAAIEWLTKAFGFEKTQAYPGPDRKIMHAEMRFGGSVVMLGPATDEQRKQKPWSNPAGRGIYIYVDDLDEHFKRAKAGGAKVVFEPEDTGWGGKRFRVLDLDGYEWSFGTYKPSAKGWYVVAETEPLGALFSRWQRRGDRNEKTSRSSNSPDGLAPRFDLWLHYRSRPGLEGPCERFRHVVVDERQLEWKWLAVRMER